MQPLWNEQGAWQRNWRGDGLKFINLSRLLYQSHPGPLPSEPSLLPAQE